MGELSVDSLLSAVHQQCVVEKNWSYITVQRNTAKSGGFRIDKII